MTTLRAVEMEKRRALLNTRLGEAEEKGVKL